MRESLHRPLRTLCARLCPALALVLVWPSAHGIARAAGDEGAAEETAGLSGEEIARRINARSDGPQFFGGITLELIDRRGNRRTREVRTIRRDVPGERQAIFFFDAPKDLRGTALLVHDFADPARDDDQWLYLPADRRVRRVATGDRGGYFVGTDFSFDDMKNGSKVGLADYRWKALALEPVGEFPCRVVEALPRSSDIAHELGYGRVLFWVDETIWMVRRAQIWDLQGRPLKTVETRDIRKVQDIWTAFEIEVENHASGHRTRLVLSDPRYDFEAADETFLARALPRGLQTPR